ncbi:MAG: hypothetical protein ABF633_13465, partial [Clostridium sp.]|uniref:hypothetical protein n=1 Tax=Clostridium sp. TaxID=1506 RepID=UPI0039EA1DB6
YRIVNMIMKGGWFIMKNNIVYVDFNERKILLNHNTSFFNKIKKFIKKLFISNRFKNKKNISTCKRIPKKRYFS